MAGYSGTPLLRKLGIKPGHRAVFLNAPDNYEESLGTLPEGVEVRSRLGGSLDFIHFFSKRRAPLERRFAGMKRALTQTGTLWVSWPKRSSGMQLDLDENGVRQIGLAGGLVDVKICAVDDVWSGLKFVYRVRDRKGGTR